MKSDFLLAITQLSAEKNLPKDVVLTAVEAALVSAYKNAGYQQFQTLLETIKHDVAGSIFHVSIVDRNQNKSPQSPMEKAGTGSRGDNKPKTSTKIGRNDPCPCGSGKKYKHCCGK